MTDDEYTSFVRALADKIDFRHYPDWGKRYAGVLDEGRHTVANEGAIHDKFVGNTLQDAVGLIMVLYHYRRAKGLPIDDLELPDLSGFFGGDEEAEPESEASIAAYRERREGYVAAHRDTRNGNRVKLAQHDDALAYLLAPAPDLDTLTEEARAANPDLFSPSDDITALQSLEAERDEALERLAVESEKVSDLRRQLSERDAEPPPLSPDPVKHMIPEEIRNLMQEGESLSSAKRRLTELLWVEQAELRNLRGTDRENLKREAEIERLLGLFARLGEI